MDLFSNSIAIVNFDAGGRVGIFSNGRSWCSAVAKGPILFAGGWPKTCTEEQGYGQAVDTSAARGSRLTSHYIVFQHPNVKDQRCSNTRKTQQRGKDFSNTMTKTMCSSQSLSQHLWWHSRPSTASTQYGLASQVLHPCECINHSLAFRHSANSYVWRPFSPDVAKLLTYMCAAFHSGPKLQTAVERVFPLTFANLLTPFRTSMNKNEAYPFVASSGNLLLFKHVGKQSSLPVPKVKIQVAPPSQPCSVPMHKGRFLA